MGCCMSKTQKSRFEVVLDANGVARRVPEGQGTHYIYISDEYETYLEEKPKLEKPPVQVQPITRPEQAYRQSRLPFLSPARVNPAIEKQ